jgi:hypothetical protein
MDAVSGNPYDAAILKPALRQVEELTVVMPKLGLS